MKDLQKRGNTIYPLLNRGIYTLPLPYRLDDQRRHAMLVGFNPPSAYFFKISSKCLKPILYVHILHFCEQ